MEENPYVTPTAAGDQHDAPAQAGMSQAALAQLLLRAMGVFFVCDGFIRGVGNAIHLFLEQRAIGALAMYSPNVLNATSWLIADGVELAIGLYLVLAGQWIIRAVFLPARQLEERDDPQNG